VPSHRILSALSWAPCAEEARPQGRTVARSDCGLVLFCFGFGAEAHGPDPDDCPYQSKQYRKADGSGASFIVSPLQQRNVWKRRLALSHTDEGVT